MTSPFMEDSSLKITETVLNLEGVEARTISFGNHLSNKEKVFFVENRLNSMIKDFGLDENQISLINELKPLQKPELYVEGSDLNKKAKIITIQWREKAIKSFSKSQLSYMFSFNSFNEYSNEITKSNVDDEPVDSIDSGDCDCALKSDWCGGKRSCTNDNKCTIQSTACGTLYLYECDGICG